MSKILPLQSLRGILCITVVLVHFTPYEVLFFHNHFLAGSAVVGFFVLSGYVLTFNYFDKIKNKIDLINFLKKRFFRLYPLHLFFLLIFLILEFVKYYLNISFNFQSNSMIFKENNLISFFSNLFLLNTFNNYLSFNLPSWAVSAEFISSIIFGITLLLFRKKFLIFSIVIFLSFLILFVIFGYKLFIYNGYFSLFSCVLSYYLGSMLFFFNENKYLIKINNFSLFQFLNLLSFFYFINNEIYSFLILINISSILLFLVNLDRNNLFFKLITNKFLLELGNMSYSIYLSHYLIYWIITQIFRHIIRIEEIGSYTDNMFILENYNIYMSKLFISVVITIIISKYLYKFLEKKFEYKN